MTLYAEILKDLLVGMAFVAMLWLMIKSVKGARKGKTIAIAFGVLVQMFTPDPEFEKTSKIVQMAKEKEGQKQAQADSDKE